MNKLELPEIPPELEAQRTIIGNDAMRVVKVLYHVNIVFFLASDSVAKDKDYNEGQRKKMELRVRTAEKIYLKAKRKLEQFWIPPSVQEVIDEHCSVEPIDLG